MTSDLELFAKLNKKMSELEKDPARKAAFHQAAKDAEEAGQ